MYKSKISSGGEKQGITGSTLKIVALVTMLIDHIGATILERMGSTGVLYIIMRLIGRLGFPLFIFLLVEGFEHTRNRWKYLLRLAIFAIASEIPFDIAFNLEASQVLNGKLIEFSYQNVFFTLAIGLLTLIFISKVEESSKETTAKRIGTVLIVIAGMAAAWVLHTDYSAFGVLAIVVMYIFRKDKIKATEYTCITLVISNVLEITAFLIMPLISAYNGKRGLNLKYIFYIFYPLHLLVLGGICILMGI